METEKKKPLFSDQLGGEKEKQGSLDDRLTRYAKAHKRALLQYDYITTEIIPQSNKILANEFLRLSANIKKCGHWLHFRQYTEKNDTRLKSADFCKKHLLCPLCAGRRGLKYLEAYDKRLTVVLKDNPKLKPYFVTLTVKDGENLSERVSHLQSAYRKMLKDARNYNYGKKGYKKVEACKAFGGVSSVEVKRGKNSGLWHPHIHMVWLCEEAPDPFQLSKEWERYTKDSKIVDSREFYTDYIEAFKEVFKYALKFSDMTPKDTWEAYLKLTRKRLIDSFGVLRGVKVDDDLADKIEQDDTLDYIDLFYRYERGSYSLKKIKNKDGFDMINTYVDEPFSKPIYDNLRPIEQGRLRGTEERRGATAPQSPRTDVVEDSEIGRRSKNAGAGAEQSDEFLAYEDG